MASTPRNIKLAEALPPRLIRFLARYPPQAILQPSQSLPRVYESSSTVSSTSSSVPDAPITEHIVPSTNGFRRGPNPFKTTKHLVTGRWHDPIFSLRRQADLVKLAREHGVEELLPPTVKGTAERLRRREENGLQVKGTGIGQKVKGKAWERSMKSRHAGSLPQQMASEPTYYEILSLSETECAAQELSLQKIKAAYRTTLLKHHPDKANIDNHSWPPRKTSATIPHLYSVDQITKAYSVLSKPELRGQYDRDLQLQRTSESVAQGARAMFHTGVEIVDLDDLTLGDQGDIWYRSCRCGDLGGFAVTEADLEGAAEDGELNVGCKGCSLWIKVLFDVVEDSLYPKERRPDAGG
ncbi:MAG: hypothetical protein M1818_007314 [Claussenomyces sp. TS43310]|nr:MAG: hypothetical protein M1818_007314 [Claussenomyces sp. TS43310]